MATLAIETSTNLGSVAVFEGSDLIFSEACEAGRSHSAQLFAVLERALRLPNLKPVTQAVVGLGPGSYAGVRIAISAAIGYSVAAGAELIGIPSIATLAEGDYAAVGDARRDFFYFSRMTGGECVEGPVLLTATELAERLADLGTLPIFSSELLPSVPQAEVRFPCAERLGRLAVAGKSVVARDFLEPIYLRDPHITTAKISPALHTFPSSKPMSRD